jgi:hypothetical protein
MLMHNDNAPVLRVQAWIDVPAGPLSDREISEAANLISSRVRFELSKRYRRLRREQHDQRQRERDARIQARRELRELAAKYQAAQ